MSSNASVRENILSTLATAATMFEKSGVLVRLDVPSCAADADIYLYERRGLLLAARELLLLPKRPDIDPAAVRRRVKKELDSLPISQTVFIDCFHQHRAVSVKGIAVLTTDELWEQLSGTSVYGSRLKQSAKIRDIEMHYLPRSLLPVRAIGLDRFETGQPSDAIEFLLEWAAQPPFKARNILLYDERGAGKTWILKRFALAQYERHEHNLWTVPPALYVNLREYARYLLRGQGIEKSLAYFLYSHNDYHANCDIYFWDALIQSGQVILLLDGFDEMTTENLPGMSEHQYRALADYLPMRCKAVIATRGTHFTSLRAIYELFTGEKATVPSEDKVTYVPSPQSEGPRPRHDLFTISPFDLGQLAQHKTEEDLGTALSERAAALLGKHGGDDFLAQQCGELGKIPAAARYILSALEAGVENYLRIFEYSLIQPLIAYNLETGRSLVEIRYRERPDDDIEIGLVDLKTRMEVAEHIAWYLMETGRDDFDSSDIANTSAEIASTRFKAVVNDLRAQTIFAFSVNSSRLAFRLPAIQAYFTARYIFARLYDDGQVLAGVRCLGRRNLTDSLLGQAIAGFLESFATHGMVQFETGEIESFDLDTLDNVVTLERELPQRTIVTLLSQPPAYSVWTRHLGENLRQIGWALPELRELNEWDYAPLENHDPLFSTENGRSVVVAGEPSACLPPFILFRNHVTNRDFFQFIQSELLPRLVPADDRDRQEASDPNLERKVTFERRQNTGNEHPLSWKAIHQRETGSKFHFFTNNYHLLSWRDGDRFRDLEDRPVVWLSAYVIAIYCNWKTLAAGMGAEHLCYSAFLTETDSPRLFVDSRKLGYRLPSAEEWQLAARTANAGPYPWSSKNEVGLYGMICSEREWAHMKEPQEREVIQRALIVGSPWTQRNDTLNDASKGTPLPMVNTNHDVGFRVARSLSDPVAEVVLHADVRKRI